MSASLSPKLLLPSLVDSATLPPKPAQKNVDSNELFMSNAMLESTKPKVPDFPAVAQATSGPSIATLVHADSARNTIGVDDSLINSQPPPTVAPSTASTVPDRPPAAPDPVTGMTLPKTRVPYDVTSEPQLAYPPEGTDQPIPVIGSELATSSSTPSLVIINAPGHAIASMTPCVTQRQPAGENSAHHLHVHWKLQTADGEHQNSYLHESRIPVTAIVCWIP